MRIVDSAGITDAGRKRRRNEDSFVREPPLFAVADGMGGAQAGEVASRLAAAAFREFHAADELDPEERLGAIIQEANRRIYERARERRAGLRHGHHDHGGARLGTAASRSATSATRARTGSARAGSSS